MLADSAFALVGDVRLYRAARSFKRAQTNRVTCGLKAQLPYESGFRDRPRRHAQILGISQDLVVTSTPPNLVKLTGNPVVKRASGGIETPRPNAEQKLTPRFGTTNEAGESRLPDLVETRDRVVLPLRA